MILGVYWFYNFPSGLYKFEYFFFHNGVGGHGHGPAELEARVIVENSDMLISQLMSLVSHHDQAYMFVTREGAHIKISISNYILFDYDFLIAKDVETLLKSEGARPEPDQKMINPTFLRLENQQPQLVYPSTEFFQVVSTNLEQYNAEALCLRLDSNVRTSDKVEYIKSLEDLAARLNIEVFYYYEKNVSDRTNLMLVFSIGRQGLDLRDKKIVDVKLFEEGVKSLYKKFQIEKGHIGGFEGSPGGEAVVVSSLQW